mmetsp:Transcript_98082/g.299851  ORF Transcript_98082/g.299851 Transcript_98082/m.299851 type:complete len:309 (+) Transcript_98082:1484-2410(+)
MQEREQKVQAASLHWGPLGPLLGEHLRVRPLQGGLHAAGRFEHVHARELDQVGGDPWMELHCEEQAEVLVRVHPVQFLLQIGEPIDCQVHVLEQDPRAALRSGSDGFVRNREALLGAHGGRGQGALRRRRQVRDLAARVEAGHADHHDGRGRLAVCLDDVVEVETREIGKAFTEHRVHQPHAHVDQPVGAECLANQHVLQHAVPVGDIARSPIRRHDGLGLQMAQKSLPFRLPRCDAVHKAREARQQVQVFEALPLLCVELVLQDRVAPSRQVRFVRFRDVLGGAFQEHVQCGLIEGLLRVAGSGKLR